MNRAVAPGDWAEKLLSVAALSIAIELVLFKFLPDISTAVLQNNTSTLADFAAFTRRYLTPGSVHYARFLANDILYSLARLIEHFSHSTDPRLHPLRVAAGVLTPIYAYLGAHFALARDSGLAWRDFFVPYGLAVLLSLYVFYPGDMPALAFLSIATYFLLRERLLAALLLMLVTGLFRESAFHMVWMICAWAVCDASRPTRERVLWPAAFAGAFLLEYLAIRYFFPGRLSSSGGIILDPLELFLSKGMLSLTTLCSLGLAALFPVACALRWRRLDTRDWRRPFFLLNCWIFPAWVVFYRMLSGNLSEFRMLLPAIVPCIYGIAYAARQRNGAELRRGRWKLG